MQEPFTLTSALTLAPEGWEHSPLTVRQLDVERAGMRLCERVSADLHSGTIWQVTGPNGTGKTSLLMRLAGLIPTDREYAEWNGAGCTHWPKRYLGHHAGLNARLTVDENLNFLARIPQWGRVTRAECRDALHQVGLAGYEDEAASRLSSGQKRRVLLALLWLPVQPPLWLLDEPFTALDVSMVALLEDRLREYAATGGRVVLTSHQPLSVVTHELNLQRYQVQADWLDDQNEGRERDGTNGSEPAHQAVKPSAASVASSGNPL